MTSQLPLKSPLQVSIFSMRPYLVPFVQRLQQDFPETKTFEVKLDQQTAKLAQGSDAVCAFVNDDLSAPTLEVLAEGGVRCVALRCAGYDRVDCDAATSLAISILRVPGYSPYAIAEHAVCLMLSLNRQIVKATERVRYGNFALSGLVGFDMHGKTVGVIGTGKIGRAVSSILLGMGCEVIAHDVKQSEDALRLGVRYVSLNELLERSHIITLHCPLTESTKYIIDADSVRWGSRLDHLLTMIFQGRRHTAITKPTEWNERKAARSFLHMC
uniref:D-isomer specific 2-hydroxyacid dehydrogenase NAD-binding domain-containing protein n=2 Tax=Chrysotila carterae TaxID=13221 RepID=A0A7S4BXC9_CHRCT